MATATPTRPETPVLVERRAWQIAVLAVVFVTGVHIDGWAHNHGRVDESFFTPWHAVLYGCYFVLAGFLVQPVLRRRAAGASWAASTDRWERLALVGIGVFFLGGVGDMLWHTAFGVEDDFEALVSPTHLIMALGGTFMGTAAYLGSGPGSTWRRSGPAVLAAACLWAIVSFMTQYLHPLVELWPAPDWVIAAPYTDLGRALGVAGILFHAIVGVVVVLALLRADRLPRGAIGALVALTAALAASQGDSYWMALPVAGAGAAVEGVRRMLAVEPVPGWRIRVFSFAMPVILSGVTMASVAVGPGIAWSVELWAGSVLSAGLLGALVSTAIVQARTA